MTYDQQNFTVIVNWKERGFGCRFNCSYCNWRASPLLPHGPHSEESVSAFIKQCRKSFITISGGADPLYKFEQYEDDLLTLARTIKKHGYKVRIITREIEHIAKLRGHIDHFSVSLDADVMDDIKRYESEWNGLDIEYSLVLPPLPTDDIVELKPQYAALRTMLGRRLVLRENLNSIYPLDFDKLSFGHKGTVFVPKLLCLNSRYLAKIDCTGHDIVQDNEAMAGYLMSNPEVFLFGGFVRHLVNPKVHMEYGDIDVIALNPNVMTALEERFAFTFRETTSSSSPLRYFLGQSNRAGKPIQLILMPSKPDALKFINGGTYDSDTVAYSNQRFYFDPVVGEHAALNAINTKHIRRVSEPRDKSLFSINRPAIEKMHRFKLIKKQFSILD